MKKLFLAVVAVVMTALSVNAQVKIESPHPDLNIKITRCACANGIVVVDMLLTNYGADVKTDPRDIYMEAYDDEGNAYNSKNAKFKCGLASGSLNNVDFALPQDVPLKFRMQIEGVSTNATKLTLLRFPLFYSNKNSMGIGKDNPIIIRNLEWLN